MNRIIMIVNLNKGRYAAIAIVLLVLIIPVVIPMFSIERKETTDLKAGEEFNLKESDVKFRDIGIKNNTVKVYITNENKIEEINLEDYVTGAISGEMPANFEIEALRAQAVAARTFALAHMRSLGGSGCARTKGADLCDTVHCQVYVSKNERLKEWPEAERTELWNKVALAAKSTEGQVLTYNGQLVMRPQYFAASSGKTEDSVSVFGESTPYLKSVDSPGEEIAGDSYKKIYSYKYSALASAINKAFPNAKVSAGNLHKQLEVTEASNAGTVIKMNVGNCIITGPQFRNALDLHSANFKLSFNKDTIEIICLGYGHQVGMSQWGANVMAKKDNNYVQILTHYYQGTKVEKIQ